jgi:hypothetical protein
VSWNDVGIRADFSRFTRNDVVVHDALNTTYEVNDELYVIYIVFIKINIIIRLINGCRKRT